MLSLAPVLSTKAQSSYKASAWGVAAPAGFGIFPGSGVGAGYLGVLAGLGEPHDIGEGPHREGFVGLQAV